MDRVLWWYRTMIVKWNFVVEAVMVHWRPLTIYVYLFIMRLLQLRHVVALSVVFIYRRAYNLFSSNK